MSLVIDTGVFYAHHDSDAENHLEAKEAITRVLKGEYGQPYTSDYIYDETVTLTRYRMDSFEEARSVGRRIRDTEAIKILHISENMFGEAVETFEKYSDQSLSFTDASMVALCEKRGIDYILSFDDDFDGIVERLDPRDVVSNQ